MIASGKKLVQSITTDDIFKVVTEEDILLHYFGVPGITKHTIKSLLRADQHPSCALRKSEGGHIRYKDFATGENYSIIELCSMSFFGVKDRFIETIRKIKRDMCDNKDTVYKIKQFRKTNKVEEYNSRGYSIDVVVRNWEQYDYDYWKSYGIDKEWLRFARIYPIKHYIYTYDDGYRSIKGTDKLAYAYLEMKEGKNTWKIYQPYNTQGRKWRNNHDKSVISLWEQATKSTCKSICICSSTKDALCLWSNLGVPCIAIQSENTEISETAINFLKNKFTNIFILLDNDESGKKDAIKLAEETGFTKLELPDMGAKDISDLYKKLNNRREFVRILSYLFKQYLT